jgi:hypothetical protein
MAMEMSPEDRERILSRSTEMLKLAKEVLHELRHDGEEPTYGEEPSIPELAAIAQLITNMGAVGLFRDKLPERAPAPAPPQPAPAAPPVPSPETVKAVGEEVITELSKAIMDKVSEEIHLMLKDRIEGIFPELVMNTTANAAQNIDHLVDAKIQEALNMIDAKIAEALHQRGFQ